MPHASLHMPITPACCNRDNAVKLFVVGISYLALIDMRQCTGHVRAIITSVGMPSIQLFAWLQHQQQGFEVRNVISVMLHTLAVCAGVSHSYDK